MAREAYAEKRTLYLPHSIEDGLGELRQRLSRLVSKDPEAPVLIVVASNGGRVDGGMALCDRILALRAEGARIDCRVEGYAHSFAAFVPQVCEHRMCGPASVLMLHGMSWGNEGDLRCHEAEVGEVKLRTAYEAGVLATRTRKPAPYWTRLMQTRHPRYFGAEEALAVGLVDEIIGGPADH